MEYNTTSLDTVCAALCYAMGVEPPAQAAPANPDLCRFIDQQLGGKKADRILMYNPDAIAQWIEEKYPDFLKEVPARTELKLPLLTVMPSVTPVCFGTMYTGAQPEVHGIRRYEKPVITIDTIFDAMIRAGKKCAIVGDMECSLSKIFLERDMDYYPCPQIGDINAKATQLILEDKYDFLVIYNGNYDSRMHKWGPEDALSLGELRANSLTFAMYDTLIRNNRKGHNTLLGFAMDHGCHEIDGGCGSHGLDMVEDLNIVHHYAVIPATE